MAKYPTVNRKHQLIELRISGNSKQNKYKARPLYEFARAAVTRSRCWWPEQRLDFSLFWTLEVHDRGVEGLASPEAPLRHLQMAVSSLCPHAALPLSVHMSGGLSLCPSLLFL